MTLTANLENLSSRPTTKNPAKREPEEEWRDPEDARAPSPTQGVLPECQSPEPRYGTQVGECSPELVWVRRTAGSSLDFKTGTGESLRSLGRTPRIGIAEDAFSGSLHCSSVSRSAGSVGVGRDDSASGRH